LDEKKEKERREGKIEKTKLGGERDRSGISHHFRE